jgi:hypothetical protein
MSLFQEAIIFVLGLGSRKTTEIYTHVAANTFESIKNLLDWEFIKRKKST